MCRSELSAARRVILLALLIFVGTTESAPLQGSEWKPLRMGDVAVPDDSSAFVQFRSKGRLEGHSGCNRIFAEYETDAEHIFIGPVAATRMACELELMEREAALARALENARTYQRKRHKLVLFDQRGTPVLEMRQTDWD